MWFFTRKRDDKCCLFEARRVVIDIGDLDCKLGLSLMASVTGNDLEVILGLSFGVEEVARNDAAAITIYAEWSRLSEVGKAIIKRRWAVDVVGGHSRENSTNGCCCKREKSDKNVVSLEQSAIRSSKRSTT